MRRTLGYLASLLLPVVAGASLYAQTVSLAGLRSLNHAGAFHGLKQDAAGNLYTLFDAQDGVRLLKFNPDGTQLLAQTKTGQAGDAGIALDVDGLGFIAVAGTSGSNGSVTGTAGTAFPNRADSTTNSFIARFTPTLTLEWLSFVGSGKTAVTGVSSTTSAVYITGGIFASTLPVTSGGIQQAPAPASSGNGFVEAFDAATGTLQYATYLTGANGDTQPSSIAVDNTGAAYIAGTTTATGYPTTAALVPVIRYNGTSPVSGFVTKLTPAGDGFVFSTFVPGNGLTSAALDAGHALLLSGNISSGLFPLMEAQSPIASGLDYQSAVRLALDGSQVLGSTLLAPGGSSVIAAGSGGQAWVFASSHGPPPLLPLLPLETLGNAYALRIASNGMVDRDARVGGAAVNNSSSGSIPVTEGGVAVATDGTVFVAGSVAPTLSSELLPTESYDLPLAQAPTSALPSTVRDALPLATCSGSSCSGSAGLLARLSPDTSAPQLALSFDDHPNLVLRNLGTAAATGLEITANGYTVTSDCGSALAAGGECSIALAGTAAGSIAVRAANFAAFTTALPGTTRTANAVTVLPRELDFGIVASTSTPATRIVTVRNFGTTAQTFASQQGNATTASYTVSQTATTCTSTGDGVNFTIAANSTCTLTLQVTPSASTGTDGMVASTWQVGSYDVAVTGYAEAAATSLSATTVDFGRQFVNGIRAPRYLYLSNASDTAESHSTVTATNPVFTLTDECPATLQPHSVCRIALSYLAGSAPSSDALSLTVDGMTVTVLGETLPQPTIGSATVNPNLSLSAAALLVPDPVTVTTVSTAVQTVMVSNTGAVSFALSFAVTGDFTFTTDCPATLPGNAACRVAVTFTPSAPGTRQGLLSVTAGSAGPVYVALSGTGAAVLPANNGIGFGDVPLNTPMVLWLKVQQALVSATATSSDPAYKVILVEDIGYGHGQPAASAFTTAAAGSCLNCFLGIQFTPTAVGADVASIALASATAGKPTGIVVSGSGIPLSGLILTPLAEDYGTVPVHSTSASTVFQMTNGTDAAVTATGATVTGDFAVTTDSTGGSDCRATTLQPGGACALPVRFAPASVGTRTGQLSVQTSAGTASATLSGTGSDDPGVGFSPGELQFNNVPGATLAQQTITVANTGSVPAIIGTPSSSDSHFTVTSGCSTLAPAATCSLTIRYTATDSLSNGTLTVPVTSAPAGAPSTATYAIALSGLYTSETAGLEIVPGEHSTVDFGALATGTVSGARLLHVTNLTAQPLTLNVMAPRNFAVTSSTCGALAPKGGCDLSVLFTPLTGGDLTGTVFVEGTPADGSATRNGLGYLEGYGAAGSGALTIAGNIDITGVVPFGQVTSGQTAAETLTLTNPATGTAGTAITVRRVVSESPYRTTTTCGEPLAPGQTCTITVTYAPVYQVVVGSDLTTPRSDTASVLIDSDAADAPQFLHLAGQAAPVTASVTNNGDDLRTFTISQGSLTFANTAVGSASAQQSIQLANTGSLALRVLSVTASSGFADTTDCATLQPGGTCSVSVSFQPSAMGTTVGSLEIHTDGVSSLEFVSLLGTASTASVSIAPLSIDFGRVLLGKTSAQTATLSNTGSVAVTMNSIIVAGTDLSLATSSSTANACPTTGTLAAGASCTVPIVFAPTTAGTERGTLSVATSATALPLTVALSGVGTQPELVLTPTSLAFGNVTVGSSATLSLTLRNTGTVAVNGLLFTPTQNFTAGSTCGVTTLTAGSSCAVNVTFTPTVAGAATGSLTIASDDPASPIVVPLGGTGVALVPGGSFTLSVNGNSSASANVQQGIAATYSLLLTPVNGFAGTVALTCTPDIAVQYAVCSLLPPTVTLLSGAQSSTATITTVTAVPLSSLRSGYGAVLACGLPVGLLLIFLRRRRLASLLMAGLLAVGLNGCGSGGDPRIRYVNTGTYTFHVTASSTTGTVVAQTVALTLVVTPK